MGHLELRKGMNIIDAMHCLHNGMRVRRDGWMVYLVVDSEDGNIIVCNIQCLELRNWEPYLHDMLATDWEWF